MFINMLLRAWSPGATIFLLHDLHFLTRFESSCSLNGYRSLRRLGYRFTSFRRWSSLETLLMSKSMFKASSSEGKVSSPSSPSSTLRFQFEPAPMLSAPGLGGFLPSSPSLSSEPSYSSSLISSVIVLSNGFFLLCTSFSSSGCYHMVSS